MEQEEIKQNMNYHLTKVSEFLKQAFDIDGPVTTTGTESMIIGKDGTHLKGVTFVLNDSVRGQFMVTLSNPTDIENQNKK